VIRNVLLTIAMAIAVLLVVASAALAGDPSQVGKHLEDIVSPNVKSFWKIALIVGCVFIVFGRVKASVVVAFFACIVVSGGIIYNPGGFADTVNSIGQRVW
jgi:TRAP-type C4-dicarboxylate transport system permease large subunit